MKKIILSLLVVSLFASLSDGQPSSVGYALKIMDPSNGDSIVNGMTLNYWGDPSHLIEAPLNVKNDTTIDEMVWCKRDTISTVSGSDNYFCWVVCNGTTVDVSPTDYLIKRDSIDTTFVGYYNPAGMLGITTIKYTFFCNSGNDASFVIVNYNVTPTGVQNFSNAVQNALSSAYPNPASNIVSLTYSLASNATSAKIVFYNMLGQQVNTLPIDIINRGDTVKVDASGMNVGIYFCTLVVNDKTIATKKIIVIH